MARRDDLIDFAKLHGLKIVTVADIIEYRLRNETMVQRIAEAKLPTAFGEFTAIVFRTLVDFTEHLALVMGDIDPSRVRSWRTARIANICRATFLDCRSVTRANCCAPRWRKSQRRARACCCTSSARPTRSRPSSTRSTRKVCGSRPRESNLPDADFRDYGIGAQIIRDLGVRKMIRPLGHAAAAG